MLGLPINLLFGLSLILTIVGERPNNRMVHYIFKPITMLIIIGGGVMTGISDTPFGYWILFGLVISIVGDIFMMLPSDKFVQGLSAFLVTHLAYIVAFCYLYDGGLTLFWCVGVVAFSVIFYTMLWPQLGELKLAVGVYISVISVMVWLAGELYLQQSNPTNLLLLSGAIIFALSDATIAWNRFKTPFKWAQLQILLTYFVAQWLFVHAILS